MKLPKLPFVKRPKKSGPTSDLAIGVGCLWFSVDDPNIKAEDYFTSLSALLASIENVSDIKTQGTTGKYGGFVDLSEDENSHFFPHIYYAAVGFSIFISKKVQERLEAVCETENFRVLMYGHYHLPVTYIFGPADDFPRGNPSRAIVLVRRYLEEKLKDNDEFSFGCIGPSPFHADFVTSTDILPGSLEDQTVSAGYKKYIFGHDEEADDGLHEFLGKYGDTFSLFYYMEHVRSKILDAERRSIDGSGQLLEQSKSDNWLTRVLSSPASGRLIDEINEANLENQLHRSFIASALDDAEKSEPHDRFGDLAYHFNDLRRYAVERENSVVKSIVETSEKRRQGIFQNVTVLIAGLAGGVLGAILGSALTFALTSSRPEGKPMKRDAINLGLGMKLIPAPTPSGFCIEASAPTAAASGKQLTPTAALPTCSHQNEKVKENAGNVTK